MLPSVFAQLHANYYLATLWTSRTKVTRTLINPACGMSFLTSRCPAGSQPLRYMGTPRCKQPALLTLFMPLLHLSISTTVIPHFPSRTFVALSVPVHAQSMRIGAQSSFGASLNPSLDPLPARSKCLTILWTHVAHPIRRVPLEYLSQVMFWRRFRSSPVYRVLQQWMRLQFPLSYVSAEKTWTTPSGIN